MKLSLSDTLPEALAEALGRVVADCRRQWEQELELLRAERRSLVAELRLAALSGTTPEPAVAEPAKPAAPAKAKGARA